MESGSAGLSYPSVFRFTGTVQLKGGMPGLTRPRVESGPQIVQPPISSGLRPMMTMVIRRCG